MGDYNYSRFAADHYDLQNTGGPSVGQRAPDVTLTSLEGQKVHIEDFSGDFLVLEFGSVTCPLFQSRRSAMSRLLQRFDSASFWIVYVREAHPGARIPAHASEEDKLASAAILLSEFGEQRRILIDDLEGRAHLAFGGNPNSVFVINRNGCVVFRMDWNNPRALGVALERLLSGKPASVKSFFKPANPRIAVATFRRAGAGSARDFLKSFPRLVWESSIRCNIRTVFGAPQPVLPNTQC